jgi:hypothetical protein
MVMLVVRVAAAVVPMPMAVVVVMWRLVVLCPVDARV